MPNLNRTRRMIASTVTAAGIVALAGTAVAVASTPRLAGTEHLQIISATAQGPVTAIAYGAFTDAGTAHIGSGKAGTLHLGGGVITLSHAAGKGSSRFNPATCLTVVRQPGTFRITGGTGRFKGLAGRGTYLLSFTMIGARSHGACSATKPPVAQQELLELTGHIH